MRSLNDLLEPAGVTPLTWLRRMETSHSRLPVYFACFAIDVWKRRRGWSDVQALLRIYSDFGNRISFQRMGLTRRKISDRWRDPRRCRFNVEVIENQNAERPAVRSIAWLGVGLLVSSRGASFLLQKPFVNIGLVIDIQNKMIPSLQNVETRVSAGRLDRLN